MNDSDELLERTERLWSCRERALQAVADDDLLGMVATLAADWMTAEERADLHMVTLCEAAKLGRAQLCRSLSADVDDPPDEYVSPLVVALDAGHDEIARMLAGAGVGIDQKKLGRAYPAHLAAERGAVELLELILDHGDPVDRRAHLEGERELTPLMFAARKGQAPVIELLLSRGADPELRDADGRTALDHARERRQAEVEELLAAAMHRETGLPVNWFEAIERGDVAAVERLVASQDEIDDRDDRPRYRGMTGLILAVSCGHVEVARRLLELGADLRLLDSGRGRTAPNWPSISFDDKPIDMRRLECEPRRTALHYAAEAGSTEAIELLLSHGASSEAKDDHGMTPLHLAALRGHVAAVDALLEAGADLRAETARDPRGDERKTPLALAAERGHAEVAERLLRSASPSRAPTPPAPEREPDLPAEGDADPEPWPVPPRDQLVGELGARATREPYISLLATLEQELGAASPLSFAPWIASFRLPPDRAAELLARQEELAGQGGFVFRISRTRAFVRVGVAPTADPREVIVGLGVAADAVEPDVLIAELDRALAQQPLRIVGIGPCELELEWRSSEVDPAPLARLVERLGAEGAEEAPELLECRIVETGRLALGWG